MNKNYGKLSFAAGLAASIVYTVCTLIVLFLPKHALKISAAVNHLSNLDLLQPLVKVTISGYITGLIAIFVSVYVLVALTAYIYNSSSHR